HSGNKSFVDASLVTADTIAALDAEKSTSPGRGPEVIGLRTAATPGIYRFYVKDMQNATNSTSTALAASGARVDVFQDSRGIASFFPPPSAVGTVWEVFSYDGARIFARGVISFVTPPTSSLP